MGFIAINFIIKFLAGIIRVSNYSPNFALFSLAQFASFI